MIYPDFFIGGAQKCGTTSLSVWLNEHPHLQCSTPKEPRFFSSTSQRDIYKDYSAFFANNRNEKALLFEASTSIMNDGIAIDKIKDLYPCSPKFIFILKNPVERAISAYYHMFKHSSEKRSIDEVFSRIPKSVDAVYDFEKQKTEQAIEQKLIDVSGYKDKYDNYLWPYYYLYNSRYSYHLGKFEEAFGKDNILTLTLEGFEACRENSFRGITRFLGVNDYKDHLDTSIKSNSTIIPSYVFIPFIRKTKCLLGMCRSLDKNLERVFKRRFFQCKPIETPVRIIDSLNVLLQEEIEFYNNINTLSSNKAD